MQVRWPSSGLLLIVYTALIGTLSVLILTIGSEPTVLLLLSLPLPLTAFHYPRRLYLPMVLILAVALVATRANFLSYLNIIIWIGVLVVTCELIFHTARHKDTVETELRKLENLYRHLIEQVPATIYIDQSDDKSTNLYTSPQSQVLTGYTPEEWGTIPALWKKLIHPDDLERVEAEHLRTNRTGEPFDMEYRLVGRDERVVWVRDTAVLQTDPTTGQKRWHGLFVDISERKKIEQALSESEERYRKLIELMPDLVLVIQDRLIVFANPACALLLGYPDVTAIEGKPLLQVLRRVSPQARYERIHYPTPEPKAPAMLAILFLGSDDPVQIEILTNSIVYKTRPATLIVGRDVSARRKAEEALQQSEERLRALIDLAPSVLHVTDREGRNTYVSPNCEEVIGYAQSELLNYNINWVHADDRHRVNAILERAFREEINLNNLEYKAVRKNGEIWYASSSWHALHDNNGGFQGYIMQTIDITDRKENEQILRALARENTLLLEHAREDAEAKSILLDEVNHRVKNNLAAILGILEMEMQAPFKNVEDALSAMQDVQSRIRSLSAVHDMLSASRWAPLALNTLTERIIQGALNNSPVGRHIQIEILSSEKPAWIVPKQATALVLILNELTMNSIKYAFQDRQQGKIKVCMQIEETEQDLSRVRLEYQDDGPGWPEDVISGQREGLGLRIVRLSVRSPLLGDLVLENKNGASAILTFILTPDQRQRQLERLVME